MSDRLQTPLSEIGTDAYPSRRVLSRLKYVTVQDLLVALRHDGLEAIADQFPDNERGTSLEWELAVTIFGVLVYAHASDALFRLITAPNLTGIDDASLTSLFPLPDDSDAEQRIKRKAERKQAPVDYSDVNDMIRNLRRDPAYRRLEADLYGSRAWSKSSRELLYIRKTKERDQAYAALTFSEAIRSRSTIDKATVFLVVCWLFYRGASALINNATGITGGLLPRAYAGTSIPSAVEHAKEFVPPWGLPPLLFQTMLVVLFLIFVVSILAFLYKGYVAPKKNEKAAAMFERFASLAFGYILGKQL